MTDKKRKLIGNALVFAVIVIAALIYCRPLTLTELLDIPEGEAPDGYIVYPIFQNEPPIGIDTYLVTAYEQNENPVPKEEWDAWIASIRIRRGPLNWLGNLYPSPGGHSRIDTPWYLYLTKEDGGHFGNINFYGDGRFDYTGENLNKYLPCYVQNANEVHAQAMALLDRYGKQQ